MDDGVAGAHTFDVAVLGPLAVLRDGQAVPLGSPQQRAVLAVLATNAGRVVTRERLVDAIWGEDPAAAARLSIRAHISHLRQALEPDRADGEPYRVLVTESSGYRLAVPESALDAARFEALARRGRSALESGDAAAALTTLDEALALWRGEVLVDLPTYPFVVPRAARLDDLRAAAGEDRVQALLDLDRPAAALAEADRLLALHPLREALAGQRMLALYRTGRQSEALAAYREMRTRLADELGIEPNRSLQRLHQRILQQDPTLLPPETRAPEAREVPEPHDEHRQRRRLRRVASVAVVAVGVSVVLIGAQTAPRGDIEIAENTIGALDLSGHVVQAVASGTDPGGVAWGGGSLWVANQGDGSVLRIDPQTSGVLARFEVGHSPAAILATATDVWVANAADATVSRINLASNRVVQAAIGVGTRPEALAAAPDGVWVANSGDNTIQLIDGRSGHAGLPIDVGDGPDGLLRDGTTLWVANGREGTVSRLDAATGETLASPIQVGAGPRGLARVGDEVWVADQLSQSVSRVDPRTNRVRTVFVGEGPTALGVLGGSVWVTEQYAGTLTRIDPTTGALSTVAVGAAPRGLVTADDRLWFSAGASSAGQHVGGTLTVAAVHLPGEQDVDPVTVYEYSTAWANRLVYEGLVALNYADGQDSQALVPSLATSLPRSSDGGRTYTFELRRGIRYSTGAEVTATDFARGFRRALLSDREDVAALYRGVVGAPACVADHAHCDLSRGVEADDVAGRISFHLIGPDPDFVYKLAWLVVPTPADYVEGSATPLPGVGPYQLSTYNPGVSYTLTRNPYFTRPWSVAAVPAGNPDVINWVLVPDVRAGVEAVDAGRADLFDLTPLGDRSQTAALAEDLSIRAPTRLHRGAGMGTFFVGLNSSAPPFDNRIVRQAFNFAIDRRKVVDIEGGPLAADVSCQLIQPGFPGYRAYCPYTANPDPVTGEYHGPDIETARRLVDLSGSKGMPVTVTGLDNKFNPPLDDYAAEVLSSIGYTVTINRLPDTEANEAYFYADDSGIQVWSGGFFPDYPRPSTYFDLIFRCPTDGQVRIYAFHFCDPETDRAADAAQTLLTQNPSRGMRAWADVQHRVVDDAPVAFGVTVRSLWYSSPRVQNYRQAEIYGPLFSQIWLQ